MLSSNVSTSRSTLKPPLGRMMGGWLSKDSSISSERQREGRSEGCIPLPLLALSHMLSPSQDRGAASLPWERRKGPKPF